jgi:hypothetical protein
LICFGGLIWVELNGTVDQPHQVTHFFIAASAYPSSGSGRFS